MKKYLNKRIKTIGLFLSLLWAINIVAFIFANFHPSFFGKVIIFAIVVFVGSIYVIYKYIYIPYNDIEHVLQLFSKGYTTQEVFESKIFYSKGIEKAFEYVKQIYSGEELLNASKRQAQYLALQNQINPHFLYNTLEGIRAEALISGLDIIADMTEALSVYFRYTISKVENLVTVKEELNNIDNYFKIQKYRFGDRIDLCLKIKEEDKEEIMKYYIPKLTLQPIVENGIIHGLESKLGKGELEIIFEITKKRMLIQISDNGIGMDGKTLERLNKKLMVKNVLTNKNEKKGGIALVNVNNRLKLLFGEEYYIKVHSKKNIGTDVYITLPIVKDKKLKERIN